MTGFESKRQAAQAKVQEEMQAVFTKRQAERDKLQDEPDMLLIVYQRGFADGKKAQRKPLTEERLKEIWYATQNIMGWYSFQEIARAIETAHNIKEQP
jgi:hypothetical protein